MGYCQTAGNGGTDRMKPQRRVEARSSRSKGSLKAQTPAAGLCVIVMAAGLGKRMRSKQAKVLHQVAGQPMVLYSVKLGLKVAGARRAVVVGHQNDQVRQVLEAAISDKQRRSRLSIVEQQEQLGTGHAVLQSRSVFAVGTRGAPA